MKEEALPPIPGPTIRLPVFASEGFGGCGAAFGGKIVAIHGFEQNVGINYVIHLSHQTMS